MNDFKIKRMVFRPVDGFLYGAAKAFDGAVTILTLGFFGSNLATVMCIRASKRIPQ